MSNMYMWSVRLNFRSWKAVELDGEIQVVLTLPGSQKNFADIYLSNHGIGLTLGVVVVTWEAACLLCPVGHHQISSNHLSFSCWIVVIFVSFELILSNSKCPFQHVDRSGKAHALNNTDIVTIHRSSLHCELTHSPFYRSPNAPFYYYFIMILLSI